MATSAPSTKQQQKSPNPPTPPTATVTSKSSSSSAAKPSTADQPAAAAGDSDEEIFNDDIWTQNLEDVGKETMESLIWEGEESYIAQVAETVRVIKEAITKKDLDTISKQGHFLKGSSATIGLKAVPASCEKLQNLGKGKDEAGGKKIEEGVALERAQVALDELEVNHEIARKRLEKWRDEEE